MSKKETPEIKKPTKNSKSKSFAETTTRIMARHDFDEHEMKEVGQNFSQTYNRRKSIEAEKKQMSADYTAQLKRADAELEGYSQKMSNGFEMRETECRIEFNSKKRIKSFFRIQDDSHVKDEAMTAEDFQLHFPIVEKLPKTDIADAFDKAEAKKEKEEEETTTE